jgi:hypothetical protein
MPQVKKAPHTGGPLKNPRRERYAQARFKGATEFAAYKAAGYKGTPNGRASKIEAIPDVQSRIQELSKRVERRNVMDKKEALEMLSTSARSAFEFFRKFGKIGPRGITIKAADLENNPEAKTAVREFVVTQDGDRVTVKLHDFREMIDTLAKLEGWEAPRNLNITRRPLEQLTDEELAELDPAGKV